MVAGWISRYSIVSNDSRGGLMICEWDIRYEAILSLVATYTDSRCVPSIPSVGVVGRTACSGRYNLSATAYHFPSRFSSIDSSVKTGASCYQCIKTRPSCYDILLIIK
jgi:hypothetical protein